MTGHPRTVVIVGMPASGKSTVGHAVAKRLGVTFADTDTFTDDGEAAFRHLEEEVVAEALGRDGVLSLGGGAILSARTRDLLRDHLVVWLDVSVATATRRAGMTQLRPLLLGDVRSRMQALLDARLPLYREVATLRIDTNRRPVSRVAAEIVGHVLGEEPTEPDQPNEEQE